MATTSNTGARCRPGGPDCVPGLLMSPALGREATITTAHVITGPRSSRRMSALLGLRLSQPALGSS